jgi:hypothetical protein
MHMNLSQRILGRKKLEFSAAKTDDMRCVSCRRSSNAPLQLYILPVILTSLVMWFPGLKLKAAN